MKKLKKVVKSTITYSSKIKKKLENNMFRDLIPLIITIILFGLITFNIASSRAVGLPENTPETVAPVIYNPMGFNQPDKLVLVVIDLPPAFSEDYSVDFNNIEQALRNARNTSFLFRVMGMGGDALMLNNFIRAIQDSQ